MLKKMEVLWHKALRWCTNLFSSTPVNILPIEACILPLSIALLRKRRMAALRIPCSSPHINPVSSRLSIRFSSRLKFRSPDSCRHLIKHGSGAYGARSWDLEPNKKPGTTTHLPVDALFHTIAILHSSGHLFPEIPPSQQSKDPAPAPSFPPQSRTPSYGALRAAINTLALQEWSVLPLPSTYFPQYSTSPHPFMGLDRFTAGRIHQIRAGKSYLAAHPSWHSPSSPSSTLCPRCQSTQEDMAHAIIACPATASLRHTHMPSIVSIENDSPLWSSAPLLVELACFIHAARINYPPANTLRSRLASNTPQRSLPPSPYLLPATPPGSPLWATGSDTSDSS